MPPPEHASEDTVEKNVAQASTDERQTNPAGEQEKRDADAMMVTGAGIGVFGAVAAAIGGAVCPLCVVAAPALLGVGAFRRWRASRVRQR